MSFQFPWGSARLDDLWDLLSLGVAMSGLVMRAMIVGYVPSGTSGRNIVRMKAEHLNTTGLYSVMRHPIYVANFLIFMGVTMFFHQWAVTLIAAFAYWMYYERIMMAEEAFLHRKFGVEFELWAAKTRAVFPKLRNWQRPNLSFSILTVMRREHATFFAIVAVMTLLELIAHLLVEHRFHFELGWMLIFFPSLAIYLGLRTMKNHTRWLHVEGR
jgi:protein-S-isoprenylcysteine O-methyltransferase Ste14